MPTTIDPIVQNPISCRDLLNLLPKVPVEVAVYLHALEETQEVVFGGALPLLATRPRYRSGDLQTALDVGIWGPQIIGGYTGENNEVLRVNTRWAISVNGRILPLINRVGWSPSLLRPATGPISGASPLNDVRTPEDLKTYSRLVIERDRPVNSGRYLLTTQAYPRRTLNPEVHSWERFSLARLGSALRRYSRGDLGLGLGPWLESSLEDYFLALLQNREPPDLPGILRDSVPYPGITTATFGLSRPETGFEIARRANSSSSQRARAFLSQAMNTWGVSPAVALLSLVGVVRAPCRDVWEKLLNANDRNQTLALRQIHDYLLRQG